MTIDNADQYARAKALFLAARQLKPDRRDEFLRVECQDDDELLREVTSLLRHDSPATILEAPSAGRSHSLAMVVANKGRLLGSLELKATRLLQRALASPGKRLVALTCVMAIMIALAGWTHSGMRRAMQSAAESQLRTILSADVKALELWIEEKKKDVGIWASRADMQEAVLELVVSSELTDEIGAQSRLAALVRLRELLDEYDRIAGLPEQDAVLNREGLVLAAHEEAMIGSRLNREGLAALIPVFQGETIFLRPHPKGAFGMDQTPDLDKPMVYVVAPVHHGEAGQQRIIAAVAFGFPADQEFSDILSVARAGETGETYIFDAQGVLLSESRFDKELREVGLLSEDPNSGSIFRIEIRDPGQRVKPGTLTPAELAERPLTTLAAQAVAAGRLGTNPDAEHVVLEPYRNYRGQQVFGVWRWMPAYAFGVATEVAAEELYKPLRFPVIAEWIRFALLAGCLLTLFGAAGWLAILGRDMEQARKLGQYTLEEKIGEGGMGVVYRARHALLQRDTAIKLLQPDNVNHEDSLARFEREAQLASSLKHPNTIEIFDFGRTPDGSFYCVMELLDGHTLEEIVRSEGPLPVLRTLDILRQIGGSLSEAHGRGLIHRDIKPANIMLCNQGGIPDFVKVLDFGLARTIQRAGSNDITQIGLVAGTPLYLAPERITDPLTIDQRSDLYSFAAVGYYLLTGQHIYPSDNQVELLQKVVRENPCRPSEITNNEIPEQLEELLLKCLSRSPEDRPPTMQAVLTEIQRIEVQIAPRPA